MFHHSCTFGGYHCDPFLDCPSIQRVRDLVNPVRDAFADLFFDCPPTQEVLGGAFADLFLDCPPTQKVRDLVNLV